MTLKLGSLLALSTCGAVALSGCLTAVQQGGACGTSTLSGSLAFPVRAGIAFRDPTADKWVVWLWDVYDAGVDQQDPYAEDWVSWCGALADAGFNSGSRPPQRMVLLTLNPPLSGAHTLPAGTGLGMTGTYYEQKASSGLSASTGSLQ